MKTKIDEKVAMDFVNCLSMMISIRHEPTGVTNDRQVMFTVAAAGEEGGFEQASDDVDMDVAVLAFEPGKESEGPVNIAIYEKRNGELTTWPRCQPWLFNRGDTQAFLAVDEEDIGFAYDGAKPSLTIVWGLPLEQRDERIATAKKLLAMMPQFLNPAETMLHRRKRR